MHIKTLTMKRNRNLDSKNSQEVIALLQSMSQKYQQTILMITHNENQAGAADRVFRMSDGVLKDLGVALRWKAILIWFLNMKKYIGSKAKGYTLIECLER